VLFRSEGRCDCIFVERNTGGGAAIETITLVAEKRGIKVIAIEHDAPTRHHPNTVYVKETYSRSGAPKEIRAEPAAAVYEQGRVSHVRGAALEELEDELTTWVPDAGQRSPNRLDALVFAVTELLGLKATTLDGGAAIAAATAANTKLQQAAAQTRSPSIDAAALLRQRMGGGGRI